MSYLQSLKVHSFCLKSHWPSVENGQLKWVSADSFSLEDRVSNVLAAMKELFPLNPGFLLELKLVHKIESLHLAQAIEKKLSQSGMIKGFDCVISYMRAHINCLFQHTLEQVACQSGPFAVAATQKILRYAPDYLDSVTAYPLAFIIESENLSLLHEYVQKGASTKAILEEIYKAFQRSTPLPVIDKLMRLMKACKKILKLSPAAKLLTFTFLLSRLQTEKTYGESLYFTRKPYNLPYALGFDAQKKFACLFEKREATQMVNMGGEKELFKAYWINLQEYTIEKGVQILYKPDYRYQLNLNGECPNTTVRGFMSQYFLVTKEDSVGEYNILAQPFYQPLINYAGNSKLTGCFLTLEEQLNVARDVSTALATMHDGNWGQRIRAEDCFVHEDIKADNVLYSQKDKRAYLIDFGWSHPAKEPNCTPLLKFVAPSPHITAPEILKQVCHPKGSGRKGDIWALGQVLWSLYEKQAAPWEHKLMTFAAKVNFCQMALNPEGKGLLLRTKKYGYVERKIALKEQKNILKWNPLTQTHVEKMYVRLIKKCLHPNPKKRCTARYVQTTMEKLVKKQESRLSSSTI